MDSNQNSIDAKIKAANKQDAIIIESFSDYLHQLQLSAKTIKLHLDNIDFFADFLNYYIDEDTEAKTLVSATDSDISEFCLDFFPRKAMWASRASAKQNTSTFKRFYTWLYEDKKIPHDIYTGIIEIIKEEKSEWYDVVEPKYYCDF